MLQACLVLFVLAIASPTAHAAWISVKSGPFVVFSDGTPKETRERAAEIEQFRFSLGELLGRHDLSIHPPLQVFFLSSVTEPAGPLVTRTGAIALLQQTGPLNAATRTQLAHVLLDRNVGRMPASIEHGLEVFLSTTEVHGARVVWGVPPAADLRDADWALVHSLVTNPDTYSNTRVLFANLENHVADDVAYRNALHKSRQELEREVAAYLQAGRFPTIDGPSRPLNPERDLAVRSIAAEDVPLHLADLLDSESETRYRALLAAGHHQVEAEEGLAMLALRRNDTTAAYDLLRQAVANGSRNPAALTAYARIQPDPVKAKAALAAALTADPDCAEAHFALGKLLSDPAEQSKQFALAAQLAPRDSEYWAALAAALVSQKQWTQAAQAWQKAEQAAATPEAREKMSAARAAIEDQRLASAEADKLRETEARESEIRRLKQEAIAELRAAEAKLNQNSSPVDTANAVPWDQLDGSRQTLRIDARLLRVECSGSARRIVLRTAPSKIMKLSVTAETGGLTFDCGSQPDQRVSVTYQPRPDPRTGTAGDLLSLTPR